MNLTAIALLALLVACVPASGDGAPQGQPNLVIVNGPRENAVNGLAEALESELRSTPECCAFTIHWATPVRAQENQRDLYDYRAWDSAARIARSLRADWAILVGLHDYERTVTERGDRLLIEVSSAVRLYILDNQGTEHASVTSRTLRDSRVQSASEPVVDPRWEPLLLPLATAALPDVAASAVATLNRLALE